MGAFFSKQFDPVRDIPDLTGRVAIVTGANTGIGFHTAQQLANHGAKVYVGSRTESKGLAAIKRMESENKALRDSGRLVWLPLDLGSVEASKAAAEHVLSQESRLDILVNNAGQLADDFKLNADGLETSVASNHVGHFAFTTALLPLLNATAKLSGADVRVINVTSAAHRAASASVKFDSIDDFRDPGGAPNKTRSWLARFGRYGRGKLANILFTKELQRRWDAEGIPALALSIHPGGVATEGAFNIFGSLAAPLIRLLWVTPLQGAFTSLFAATSPQVKAQPNLFKGAYLEPYDKIRKPSKKSLDVDLAKQLWITSERVVDEIFRKEGAAVAR